MILDWASQNEILSYFLQELELIHIVIINVVIVHFYGH